VSGIVGIVNLDGAPVDEVWLQRCTDSLAFRGPDRQAVWSRDHVGFGHAALHTTFESHGETQPQVLNNSLWIVADGRIDGRDELRAQLAAHGRRDLVSDAELILHAYDVWQAECVHHLLGDFAFAIWDQPRRQLFCARDHFGVKPFYYSRLGNSFLFSNTLNCLRWPGADRLNDQAVGDFLLFGYNHDVATTFFRDIQRLPPGHFLELSPSKLRIHRYFSLPVGDTLRNNSSMDYVDEFRQLVGQATADRLRCKSVAMLMSGGLDSTSVAAVAFQSLPAPSMKAYTVVYDRLVPSDERHYASRMAEAFGFDIEFLVADDYRLFERWDAPTLRTPEPLDHPLSAILHDHLKQVALHHRVALTGEGGDAILQPAYFYPVNLLKRLQLGRFVADVGGYFLSHRGALPPLGIRGELRRWFDSTRRHAGPMPPWLNRDFVARAGLRERWHGLSQAPKILHALRPEAHGNLSSAYWPYYFEGFDAGVSGFPLEVRSPLFDLRVVKFALALPPLPWCVDKELMRQSMRGVLPEELRLRPKSPLAQDPVTLLLRRAESAWVDHFAAEPALAAYVDKDKIPPISASSDGAAADGYYRKLLPLAFNHWLKHSLPTDR
jgi:asparagine synthase (glutamine-hydrolysing)